MSSISAVQGATPPTPLQRAKLVEGTRAEETTENSAQEAKEVAATQAKKSAPSTAHAVDHFA
ncbi:MAG: hypothetical protein QOI43_2554 [Gaiellales bacterium]|jgi:hypothetical protein|nr:hypothetical protein [Gaiellales bacterium]